MDNFALLQEPRRPWLEAESLKASFLQKSRQSHPDKVTMTDAPGRTAVTADFAALNAAYQCLTDPKERLRHLLDLELEKKAADLQSIPTGLMDLMVEVGQVCRETDSFLAARSKVTSPLLQAQMFESGMGWTDKLSQLQQRLAATRAGLMMELKNMNDAWDAAPPPGCAGRAEALPLRRLDEIQRVFSYMARWTGQMQERLLQLSF